MMTMVLGLIAWIMVSSSVSGYGGCRKVHHLFAAALDESMSVYSKGKYAGITKRLYKNLFDVQMVLNIANVASYGSQLTNQGNWTKQRHKKEFLMVGIQKWIRYVMEKHEIESANLAEPFAVFRCYFDHGPEILETFVEKLRSATLSAVSIEAVLKAFSRFINHWIRAFKNFNRDLQQYLVDEYNVQNLSGLKEMLQQHSTIRIKQAPKIRQRGIDWRTGLEKERIFITRSWNQAE